MRSIAIVNQKGGVGKTTTAVNLSAALARAGHRVCLVDLDPQAHASLHLGISLDHGAESIYSVFVSDTPLARVRQPVAETLEVVPAHLDLAAVEIEIAGEVGRELILRDKLGEDPADFDYLIFDCPPSLGLLALNALTAVEEVFLPLQPHFLALHGLSKLLRTVEVVSRRLNPRVRLSGVVLCMYETGTRLAAEVTSDVHDFFAQAQQPACPWSDVRVFASHIRRNIRLAEAPSFGQSIFDYSPNSHGAEDYGALAEEVSQQVARAAGEAARARVAAGREA